MCAEPTLSDLLTVHHEMGHIQYDMAYRRAQPYVFRGAPMDAFHEAIGDAVALSVQTPYHLYRIGLLHNATENETCKISSIF